MHAPARKPWWLLISAALVGAGAGCTLRQAPDIHRNLPAAVDGQPPDFILAGMWEGTSVSDCYGMAPCLGLKQISFTLFATPIDGLGGFYNCEQTTAACDFFNDRGVITNASLNRQLLSVEVALPDDQSCIFRSVAAPVEMEGRFFCKQRAVVIDRGVWRAERSF
jgi:hypothetical protein